MGLFQRDKEKERFYLLPGMGGKAKRRKEMRFLLWSVVAALVICAIMAGIMYFLSRNP
jgi:hypothetical protein